MQRVLLLIFYELSIIGYFLWKINGITFYYSDNNSFETVFRLIISFKVFAVCQSGYFWFDVSFLLNYTSQVMIFDFLQNFVMKLYITKVHFHQSVEGQVTGIFHARTASFKSFSIFTTMYLEAGGRM